MLFGTTFSHRHAEYLQLNAQESFQLLISLHLNVIRLGCYWNEVQKSADTYDYSALKQLLDIAEKNNQKVIVTVGMKAPRYPEFYIPSWTQSKTPDSVCAYSCKFIENTLAELKNYSCIQYWQVENEPLDPVWPDKRCVSMDILKKEVDLVRRLDPKRKIVLNLWGNENFSDTCSSVEDLADIIGIDLYYQQYIRHAFGIPLYKGPKYSVSKIKQIIENSKKPIWITELQAEPWEKDMNSYKANKTSSMSPSILQKNISIAKSLNPQEILLWGSEYWLWKKKQGDERYWNLVSQL